MAANKSWLKAFWYSGFVALAIGMLATMWVLFLIWLNQTDCNGGSAPLPSQGCGYMPQLVLFGVP
jgi:uncharacterized membrane protein